MNSIFERRDEEFNFKKRESLRFMVAAALGSGLLVAGMSPRALAQSGKYQWPKTFNVVTPVVGTANHSLAVAWSSKFQAATGVKVAVLPAPNGFARAAWLNSGEGRLAMVQASDYFDQMDAVQGYATKTAGPTDTRLIHMNMVTPWGYAVQGDSRIKSINDIGKGTRIALAKSSSFLVAGIEALLAYRNLSHNDVDLVSIGSYGANTAVLAEGRVEVTFTSPISGPSYKAEATPKGLRWLAVPQRQQDPAAYDRYRKFMAGYVPQETVAGVKSAIGVPMDHAFQANHVRANEDPEFVYQLIKWLDENHASYKGDFTHANMLSIANLVLFLDTGALQPLHEGSIRYLKEKGKWKDSYQKRQDQLVQLAQKYEKTYRDAMAAADKKGIAIEASNAQWASFWTEFRPANGISKPFAEEVLALN
ncbi:MAG: TAXI family TRAP transporter solute-binding subunit [Burkholderiales bacterium]|nr:TAXI family TRAP transporter solute-binding subunit [Burkholderiales bacterium]